MAELIQTEKAYVRDLRECMDVSIIYAPHTHAKNVVIVYKLIEQIFSMMCWSDAVRFVSTEQIARFFHDLLTVQTYLWEMTSGVEEIPPGIVNKEHIIFGNMQDLYEFHHKSVPAAKCPIYHHLSANWNQNQIKKKKEFSRNEKKFDCSSHIIPCSIFLKELEKYEQLPEDVGHCFVTWVRVIFVFETNPSLLPIFCQINFK